MQQPRKNKKFKFKHPLIMTAPNLKECLRLNGLSIKTAAEKFDSTYGQCLAKDRGKIPRRIRYRRPCLGVCSEDRRETQRFQLCKKLEEDLAARVAAAGGKKACRNLELLLLWGWQVFDDDETRHWHRKFAFVTQPINNSVRQIIRKNKKIKAKQKTVLGRSL